MRNILLCSPDKSSNLGPRTAFRSIIVLPALVVMVLLAGLIANPRTARAQVNVVTAHNDNARTGQNLKETVLKPSNVNTRQFGKLFSQKILGGFYAQPLYVSQVAIPGKGTHNVIYAATANDTVYAFDADDNGGTNAMVLWVAHLQTTPASPALDLRYGVNETPVIDAASKTMYVVTSESQGSTDLYRLHALDITTGAEKLGGPIKIQGSVPGTGTGSSGGVLAFDATYHQERSGMLLQNGVLYTAFGAIADTGPWHGWIFSYDAATLKPIDVYCTSPNGSAGGIWLSGAGLAAEVDDPSKPFGRMFVATGNGAYNATKPYSNTMSYGMTILNLDLTGGKMTVKDEFTPYNWKPLNGQDGDLGSGAPILLPTQTLASGKTFKPLIEVGKSGMIYNLDRNDLGGFNAAGDDVFQEIQTPESGQQNWGAGIWGSPAYWNNNVYIGGTNPGASNSLIAYSYNKGLLSAQPTSQSAEQFSYPGPTPSISANGTANGIVWVLKTSGYFDGTDVLYAYDATNLSHLLYSSNTNLTRDNPGKPGKFIVPTIANGKVYVGASGGFSVYGLLNATPTVAKPVISPPGATFTGSLSVTITDSTAGAKIYYTTDGSIPTVNSRLYAGPIKITTNQTISAIASATGYLQGAPVSAVFSSTANAANPVFSLASGTYSGTQTLTITDSSSGAKIYYTVDGSTPTTSSTLYTAPVKVPVSETVKAFATAPGLMASSVVSAAYDIDRAYTFNFGAGFAQALASKKMQFNGSTALDDFRLQLTNGGQNQAGSAYYTKKVNVQSFTTDFTFQLSNPAGDGITFTIQNSGLGALGEAAAGLGYQHILKSVALKFDFYDNYGEGANTTGLYTNGALPAKPAVDLTNTGINLRSGDFFDAHVTYDGKNLVLTLTDTVTLAVWSHAWPINIPAAVGDTTAWVGFTGGTGMSSASQKLTYWTYAAGRPNLPNFPVGFDGVGFYMNGGPLITKSVLQLTDGSANQASAAYFSIPVPVTSFTTDFNFQVLKGSTASLGGGFTFVLQNAGPHALGANSAGLGFANIAKSAAIKFDIFDNAGEGSDSTGVYVNGAVPTVPATNLAPTGIHLGDGETFHAHVTYDGTTLTWTLVNVGATLPNLAKQSVAINIPQTIGSNTAYVGFTASTGGVNVYRQNLRLDVWNAVRKSEGLY